MNKSVEARLEALERGNRRLRFVAGMAVAASVIAFGVGASSSAPQRVVRAQVFELVDSKGRMVGHLSSQATFGPRMALFDSDDKLAVEVTAENTGGGSIALYKGDVKRTLTATDAVPVPQPEEPKLPSLPDEPTVAPKPTDTATKAMPGAVERSYDRFKDYTSLTVDLSPPNSDMKFWVLSLHRGDTVSPKDPPKSVVMFVFAKESKTTDDLIFIVDGVRINPELRDAGWEVASWKLSTDDMLRIASAKQVSVRLQQHEYELPAVHQTALRDFASMLGP
jgi:hypothetical protein